MDCAGRGRPEHYTDLQGQEFDDALAEMHSQGNHPPFAQSQSGVVASLCPRTPCACAMDRSIHKHQFIGEQEHLGIFFPIG